MPRRKIPAARRRHPVRRYQVEGGILGRGHVGPRLSNTQSQPFSRNHAIAPGVEMRSADSINATSSTSNFEIEFGNGNSNSATAGRQAANSCRLSVGSRILRRGSCPWLQTLKGRRFACLPRDGQALQLEMPQGGFQEGAQRPRAIDARQGPNLTTKTGRLTGLPMSGAPVDHVERRAQRRCRLAVGVARQGVTDRLRGDARL